MRFAAAVLLAILSSVPAVCACDCKPSPSPKSALEKATAVFVAKVVKIDAAGTATNKVALKVSQAWKGVKAEAFEVTTADNDGRCGFSFKVGEVYLLYANTSDGASRVSACSRSVAIGVAAADLEALGKPEWTAK